MDYDNTNSGALFKNQKKATDKHTDYTGSLNVDGTDYWLSAWIKDGKSGKFMSVSVKPKEEKPRQSSAPTRKAKDDFDDVPF